MAPRKEDEDQLSDDVRVRHVEVVFQRGYGNVPVQLRETGEGSANGVPWVNHQGCVVFLQRTFCSMYS